jgi:hypothetical protein
MEKKQTAVEWFYEQLEDLLELYASEWTGVDKAFKQAKKMEKEQIIKSNRDGVDMVIAEEKYITGEDYYNETYGGNNE